MPTTLGMTGPNASLTAGATVTFTAGAWYMQAVRTTGLPFAIFWPAAMLCFDTLPPWA